MTASPLSPETWRAAGTGFEYCGHSIFYRDSGASAKPVLLLIHGFPTASWDWHPLWDALAARFRLVAPDMIGFGFSAKPRDHDYAIHDQADLHAALCARLGIGEAHLLAHDYGVSVAQELLARHEGGEGGLRLRSIAFLNGGLFPETHRARRIQKLLLSPLGPLLVRLSGERSFRRSFSAVFGPGTQPSEVELRAFWSLITEQQGQYILHRLMRYILDRRRHRERWLAAMQKTALPLRIINGPVDPVSGAHMVARYRELIPRPDTVSLPGIGHYPQVEAPQAVLDAFLGFHDQRVSA